MKKLLLVVNFSFFIVSLFFGAINVKADETTSEVCSSGSETIVKIINNYNEFKGNGFVYKSDEKYTYVITSSSVVSESHNFSVIFNNNMIKKAIIIGFDSYNKIAVYRTDKVSDVKGVCFGDSNYLYRGQENYLRGYYDNDTLFYKKARLNSVGNLYMSKNYMKIYRSVIDLDGLDIYEGVGVFDDFDRLIGMVNGYDSSLWGSSYIVDSNRIKKIADSIVKTGNYKINYIKYNIENYSEMSFNAKYSYSVSNNVSGGVVITTFKPLSYVFGGLNQGMTIVAVNGVEINNMYDLDKQLIRYDKDSKVCLKVIKNNGKTGYYFVKV